MTSEQAGSSSDNNLGAQPSNSDGAETARHDEAYLSKLVMIRGERHDEILITKIVRRLSDSNEVPDRATIVRRSEPYYGPKLTLKAHDQAFLLTAPGPQSQLLLWASKLSNDGQIMDWDQLAEVTARLTDDLPPYSFCPQCGEPLKTLKHEIRAELGCCPESRPQ